MGMILKTGREKPGAPAGHGSHLREGIRNMVKATRAGGFAAQNGGTILNCYSTVMLKAKCTATGGFVGENDGSISKSFCGGRLGHLTGGFVGVGGGSQKDGCYFFYAGKNDGGKLSALFDGYLGQQIKNIKNAQDTENLGYDLQTIFEYTEGEKVPLRFNPENWLFDTERDCGTAPSVLIKTADELYELAEKINGGDRGLAGAHIALEHDLDLGGREWIPIGSDRTNAFTGVFDGAGHTVKNFVVKNKSVQDKGFFGFLKGKVYNLSVDCILRDGLCVGGIAARCDGGTIGCCSAVVGISGKAEDAGGLVGRNSGVIFQSYAGGVLETEAIPWRWLLLPVIFALLAVLIWSFSNARNSIPIFAPVPYDPDAVINPEESGDASQPGGNFVSFQFEQNIDVDLSAGLCNFNFKNPGESNHNIVVKLQFTDSQAVTIMGSTGRTEKEQKKLESTEGYDPDTYRVTIAESGAIRPGYLLENLRLVDQANGATVPPGSYNAVAYLIFYDKDTNERAMLESQLPVVITVHD